MGDVPDGFPKFRQPKQSGARSMRDTPMGELRQQRVLIDRWMCQADGLHHPDCPRTVNMGQWVVHHVQPRSAGGADTLDNLITVWNGTTRLAAGGCHQMIHTHSRVARLLGLLRNGEDDSWFGVGIEAGLEWRFIEQSHLRAVETRHRPDTK